MFLSRTNATSKAVCLLRKTPDSRLVFFLRLSARLDLNQEPRRYKLRALPIELQAE